MHEETENQRSYTLFKITCNLWKLRLKWTTIAQILLSVSIDTMLIIQLLETKRESKGRGREVLKRIWEVTIRVVSPQPF